ncbi:hypothetical protein [Arthrobacter sp. AZCC_0090]|uniref:hypothetical protein n=1 Tax=Arthrobacter sp. AZCC_0090 TaxID=2735881 RepID=UPI001622F179|nr:hypothetical protein [Arthrobacter sp. AZCC_0090]MBB6406180.1 hypothetical protein [Arthrobacter sp. AZCC_0090]
MDLFEVISAFGSLTAAVVASVAAWWARSSAKQANLAARTLATIEQERRHNELRPLFKLDALRPNPDSNSLKLRLTLAGPSELDGVDSVSISIRDDDYRRGQTDRLLGGATEQEIRRQIWGPYRFRPGTGPYEARADETGRLTRYKYPLPVGEHIEFDLEPTPRPGWSEWTREQWMAGRGSLIKVEIVVCHQKFGSWTIRDTVDAASV